jgi:transposase
MERVVTVGLDIAKNIFHAHGVAQKGEVVFSRKLRRAKLEAFFSKLEPCLIGIEACGTAHHWARVFKDMGHTVKLMPPAYVKPYVKSQKNDAADAEAICEAVTRPTMRFAEIKSIAQQSILGLHRVRSQLVRHRTRVGNTIRSHLAEFGITAPVGREGLYRLIGLIDDIADPALTDLTRISLRHLVDQYRLLQVQILDLDRQIMKVHRSNELSKRLATIPGIGPLAASALAATIGNASAFKSGRSLAAFLGLVPRQSSTGGKDRLGRITKRGDGYLRWLLVAGAMAVVRYAQRHGTRRPWLVQLLARRPAKTAIVALANKMARMAWALMTSGESYREPKLKTA